MKKILVGFFVLMFVMPLMTLAADYFPKNKNNTGNVVVSDEGQRNLYIGGASVIVNSKIFGDLFAAGSSITLANEVEEDFFAIGGNIIVAAPVTGDVRVAGGNIVIDAPIAGDLLVAGGTVSLSQNATIGGDLWVAGGIVNINGVVTGNLKIAGGEIYINTTVGGTVDVQADEKLTFGTLAVAQSKITYYGKKDPIVDNGAQISEITRIEKSAKNYNRDGGGILFGFSFIKTLALLVAGLVLLSLMRTRVNSVVTNTKNKFWHNVGLGFIGMIIVPVLSIILVITLIGSILGVTLMFWYIFALILCAIFSMMTLGHFIETWINKKKAKTEDTVESRRHPITWKTILWGSLVGIILAWIPVLGWLILYVFYLATFGSMLREIKAKIMV